MSDRNKCDLPDPLDNILPDLPATQDTPKRVYTDDDPFPLPELVHQAVFPLVRFQRVFAASVRIPVGRLVVRKLHLLSAKGALDDLSLSLRPAPTIPLSLILHEQVFLLIKLADDLPNFPLGFFF